MIPRKPRQRQSQHQRYPSAPIQASDYESDALNYYETHTLPQARTNTQLNLSVLRRYNPTIRSILSIAASAVVYVFTPESQQWEKSGVEGTMFVCDQTQDFNNDNGTERYCLMVLNRRGLDNLILDLSQAEDVEITSELLIMRFQGTMGEPQSQKILGFWIHMDKTDTREVNGSLIQQCWERTRVSMEQEQQNADNIGGSSETHSKSAQSAGLGRRISLTDLFQLRSVY